MGDGNGNRRVLGYVNDKGRKFLFDSSQLARASDSMRSPLLKGEIGWRLHRAGYSPDDAAQLFSRFRDAADAADPAGGSMRVSGLKGESYTIPYSRLVTDPDDTISVFDRIKYGGMNLHNDTNPGDRIEPDEPPAPPAPPAPAGPVPDVEDPLPNISQHWNMPDDDRAYELSSQASLPSDMVNPADAMGDAEWQAAVDADILGMGENAARDFGFRWDWEMTPGQRASALADVALRREMAAFVDDASGLAAKPPVDPQEFAREVAERRAERARRF